MSKIQRGQTYLDLNKPSIKLKITQIIEKIRAGYSRQRLMDYVQNEMGYSYQQAVKYVHDAYEVLTINSDKIIEKAKGIQVERLEELLKNTLECKDNKTAAKVLDMINKIYSLYVEKQQVDLNVNNLKFSFGDEIPEGYDDVEENIDEDDYDE